MHHGYELHERRSKEARQDGDDNLLAMPQPIKIDVAINVGNGNVK